MPWWLVRLARSLALAVVIGEAGAVPPAHAHAVIVRASLEEIAIRPNVATTVILLFNSRIEVQFSQVFLLDAEGNVEKLKVGPGPQPDKLAVDLPSLKPGAYALRYKVLSADGHFTDNVLRFQVAGSR